MAGGGGGAASQQGVGWPAALVGATLRVHGGLCGSEEAQGAARLLLPAWLLRSAGSGDQSVVLSRQARLHTCPARPAPLPAGTPPSASRCTASCCATRAACSRCHATRRCWTSAAAATLSSWRRPCAPRLSRCAARGGLGGGGLQAGGWGLSQARCNHDAAGQGQHASFAPPCSPPACWDTSQQARRPTPQPPPPPSPSPARAAGDRVHRQRGHRPQRAAGAAGHLARQAGRAAPRARLPGPDLPGGPAGGGAARRGLVAAGQAGGAGHHHGARRLVGPQHSPGGGGGGAPAACSREPAPRHGTPASRCWRRPLPRLLRPRRYASCGPARASSW
jgi:hypothetical protein